MKTSITSEMRTYLSSRVTKHLCRCWRIDTVDGQIFGYTSHTRAFTFESLIYEPILGFTASALKATENLSPDNITLSAFLSSQNEKDIYAGVFDNATVSVFIVNYLDLTMGKIIEKTGFVGEITRSEGQFSAEINGLAILLNTKIGRVYGIACDARLGDARCGVNLATAAFTTTGTIASSPTPTLTSFGVSLVGGPFTSAWFTEGKIQFTSGSNNGMARDIRMHTGNTFMTFLPFPFDVVAGDAFTAVVGCTKDLTTCLNKFDNVVRFRGFPYVPTNEDVFFSPIMGSVTTTA